MQRDRVEVVGEFRGELAHRLGIGLVERPAILGRVFRIARRQRLDEGLFLVGDVVRRVEGALQPVPGLAVVVRVHLGVHVRPEHQRGAPPAHRAVRVEFGGFQERALGGVVVEAVGQRQALVEPALHLRFFAVTGML